MPEPSSVRVVLHPAARTELKNVTAYYRKEAGREEAERFLAEFWRCANWLREFPEAGPPAEPEGVRRKLLQDRFPYTLYYVALPGRIRIVKLAHQRQEPKDFSDRLRP